MNNNKTPFEIFNQAVEAARRGDESKLDELGWERLERDGEVVYEFTHPSDLQRFMMLEDAKKLMSQASLLMDMATDYDCDSTYTVRDDEVWVFEHVFSALQEATTLTDEEILGREDIYIPNNFPIG